MSQRVVAVVQARMGSSRLPGKVLRDLGGRPVLQWVVDAARAAGEVDDVVVATSTEASDDAIVAWAATNGIAVVRGSESDVLSRFMLAATETGADAVVRLTADCPLLDPVLIDQVVTIWRRQPALGYVATTLIRTLPRGLDVELVSRAALEAADLDATGHHRVHVTSYLYSDESATARAGIVVAPAAADLRVTLDVEQDAVLLDALVALLRPSAGWREIVSTLREHPEIAAVNGLVEQKRMEDG